MFDGNPNRPMWPYAPEWLQMAPQFRDVNNPFKLGEQRVQGQLAFQPNRYGFGGGTNTRPRPFAPPPISRLRGY